MTNTPGHHELTEMQVKRVQSAHNNMGKQVSVYRALAKDSPNVEQARCYTIAAAKLEEAEMWAVKGRPAAFMFLSNFLSPDNAT